MRLFVALPCDERVRHLLLALQRRIHVGRAKVSWSQEHQLHLTLKFLGETPDSQAAAVARCVQQAAGDVPPFELEMAGTGCFPPAGPVRIVWVGGRDPSGHLQQLVQRLEDELAAIGVPRDARTFSQHFTIGRVKSDDSHGKLRQAVQMASFEAAQLTAGEVVLFQSTLSAGGARYTPVAHAPLGDNA